MTRSFDDAVRKCEEYTPLTSSTDADTLEDDCPQKHSFYRHFALFDSPHLFWACLSIAVLSAFNVVLLPFTLHGTVPMSPTDLDNLPYQHQHVGLSRLASYSSSPAFYRSWPDQITRLSKKYVNTIYGTGMQILLSSKDVTLMKFLIPPHGGASCAIAWYSSRGPMLSPRSEDVVMEGNFSQVEVWSIISADPSSSISDLDLDEVSYLDRPIRGELLGTLNLNASPNATTVDFACPLHDGVLAVELRCLLPVCYVKLNQASVGPGRMQGKLFLSDILHF